MPDDGPERIALRFDPEPGEDGLPIVENEVPVTHLYGGIYRLEGSSAFGEVYLGDSIEVEPAGDDTFRLVRVVERSGYQVRSVGVSRAAAESDELARLCAMVEAEGGAWERMMGGILIFHLPPGAALDVDAALEDIRHAAVPPRPAPAEVPPWWKVWTRLRRPTRPRS